MTRVATMPVQRTLADALQRGQQQLAASQLDLATRKKVRDYAALGTDTVRNLSARTLIARHEAFGTVGTTLATTLQVYDANLVEINDSVSAMRTQILTAIGTGRAAGLQETIEQAFDQFRSAINAYEGGQPLFAGSRTDTPPFVPADLAATIGLTPGTAFTNDQVRASTRVADGVDIEHGLLASEFGSGIFEAFRTLAEAGSIGPEPTAAQMAKLSDAIGRIDSGLGAVRQASAQTGRRQVQVDKLTLRAEDRTLLLNDILSRSEDADLGTVANEIAQRKTTLEASYAVFGQLSQLSLVQYLR
jgi:flagellar hook-associated protein 3 FlgL